MTFDYTEQKRRPTAAQIVSDWKKAGRPLRFEVTYGETYAEFTRAAAWGNRIEWQAYGNGCRGVQRDKVQAALNKADQITLE